MKPVLGAGLFLQTQKISPDDLKRFQYIPAPPLDLDRDAERRFLMRAEPCGTARRVTRTDPVFGQVSRLAGKNFPAEMEPQSQKGLSMRAIVPDGECQLHRLPCFGQEVFGFQKPLHIVQTVSAGPPLQPEEQRRQKQPADHRRHSAFSSGTVISDSSLRSRWAAASAFMPLPITTRWLSTAGASPLTSSGIT